MIIDVFMYYNESEVAEIRLNELKSMVDKFIVIRGTTSFRGNVNPHDFPEHLRWPNVEVHDVDIPISTPRTGQKAWDAEFYLRRYPQSLLDQYRDSDRFIFSDCDEIPMKRAILELGRKPGVYHVEMDKYFYNFETYMHGTTAAFTCLKSDITDLQTMRHHCQNTVLGGWELSCFGDAAHIQEKLKNFSHWEIDKPEYTDLDKIQERMDEGRDIIDRPTYVGSPIYPLPDYVLRNKERYSKWLMEHKWFS